MITSSNLYLKENFITSEWQFEFRILVCFEVDSLQSSQQNDGYCTDKGWLGLQRRVRDMKKYDGLPFKRFVWKLKTMGDLGREVVGMDGKLFAAKDMTRTVNRDRYIPS